MVITAKVFIIARNFVGEPKLTDFLLIEEELDSLNDGEFIAEARFFGISAGLRVLKQLFPYPLGSVVFGGQVARLLAVVAIL